MAMTGGSVTGFTLDANGNVTFSGSGLALALATAHASALVKGAGFPYPNPIPSVGSTAPPYSSAAPATASIVTQLTTQVTALYTMAEQLANAYGPTIVTHITSNASVSVPATGILDSTSHACTGTATGTVT